VLIEGGFGGMHLTLRLAARYPDHQVVAAARAHQIAPVPLSEFVLHGQPEDNGLVIGYGNTARDMFEPLVKRLRETMRTAK
ncbi:MAG: PLP-dependent aminotransferase family protein, partial [Janthinobacterium lividum]